MQTWNTAQRSWLVAERLPADDAGREKEVRTAKK
jgi:hypothetical protein